MKHENIETPEVLNRWAQEVDRKFEMLDDAYSKFNINTGNWKNEATEDAVNYKFGKFLGAIQRGDKQTVYDMGGRKSVWNKAQQDLTFGKADLGTPGTGDASGTDWQYLVPQTIFAEVIQRFANTRSEVVPALTRVTMTGRLHKYAVESTEPAFTFRTNEVTDIDEENPDWTDVDLEAETFAYWVGCSDELVEDTFVDLGNVLREQAAQAWLTTVESQVLNGTSPFTGILQHGSISSITQGGIGFADIGWTDLLDMIDGLSTRRKRQNLSFCMHPTIWSQLISEQDAQGKYYFDPSYTGPKRIWGYPCLTSDSMPALTETATDTKYVIAGNFKKHLLGVRVALEARYYPDTMYSVQDSENFFRFRTRIASIVALPAAFYNLKSAAS